ncbi:hypothetical protein CrLKS3_g43 [Cylindrospermopsis phage Cr-LKS3]|nr:hypothetical protein CrLKS3_g43 [Cylindrospermopsis phage Cr-LKS3]
MTPPNRDAQFAEVLADTTWVQIEAADIMASQDPDGLLVIAAREACHVIDRLVRDNTLAELLTQRGRAEVDAAIGLLIKLKSMGAELERRIEAEAELRFERECERWESAA